MSHSHLFTALFLATLPAVASATEPGDSLVNGQEIQQVVVTGTRSPKLLLETPVLTQVISHADIVKADATNLKDLLQQVMPGVEFSFAQNQMVHLNFSGFGGQSILILVVPGDFYILLHLRDLQCCIAPRRVMLVTGLAD